ncbi:elongation factor P--(R)-beta-lysine ligase [Aliidiomarina sanyensis]|uniref:Elongation factor P lysine(34) lysyltransferase n=1 Tax=Aliidiomarina sanyensis TaxID=1249555 RepID=A0A432WAN5_9GAMM|nr:elongation factor P--(R)-beta-lysine ligase [Aliidiomarina sanyensis]RUO27478.1 elongation factor P lysine(34) lysyltransferase [Aliidiomarina sanyensis]
MSFTDWRPTASWETLKIRADMLKRIRAFFADRNVLEVETPLLAHAGVTDLHLHNATTRLQGPGLPKPTTFYLQTSPEYAMKRLLAAGSGAIFQIGKVVRDDEISRRHNPEFTLLEWYRPGFTDDDLIAETDRLLQVLLGTAPADVLTYQAVFLQVLDADPLTPEGIAMIRRELETRGYGDALATEEEPDVVLQLAMSVLVEPAIGQTKPCVVKNFPASQAALARIHKDDSRVAHRFEVFYQGLELANGFWELTDAHQQRARFERDNAQRIARGLAPQPIDERFLSALESGMPDCAGIALGFDRLVMLKIGARSIEQVLTFPTLRA